MFFRDAVTPANDTDQFGKCVIIFLTLICLHEGFIGKAIIAEYSTFKGPPMEFISFCFFDPCHNKIRVITPRFPEIG